MGDNVINVNENTETMVITASCPDKRVDPVQIRRCNKWGHYSVQAVTGTLPKALEGTFTNSSRAIEFVVKFLKDCPKTSARKRKEIRESRGHAPVV